MPIPRWPRAGPASSGASTAGWGSRRSGSCQPPVHALLYQRGAPAGFGHAASLLCAHYRSEAGGACGIWRHRNGVCSTWFCKHGRGATGQRFWQALEQLLAIVERTLARWCLLEIGVDAAVLARLLPRGSDRGRGGRDLDAAALDGKVSEVSYRALWGSWLGRERELFRRAAGLVTDLRWADVSRIGGAGVDAFARVVADAHRQQSSDDVPPRLTVGAFRVVVTGRAAGEGGDLQRLRSAGSCRACWSTCCPISTGAPTAEALRRIRTERDVNVQPDLVRRLVDFGILIERP